MDLSNELKVGLAVILTAVIFFFGYRFFQNVPLFGGTYALETSLENASGLTQGSAVQINGITVGEVESLRLNGSERNVHVRFTVDDEYAVPQGSRTNVAGFAALGSVQLSIRLGPPGNAPVEPGGFIPSATGAGGDVMSALTRRGPELLSNADTTLLAASSALQTVDALVSDPQGDLRQTLGALRGTAASLDALLRQEQGRLRAAIGNFAAASEDLSAFTDSTLTPATSDSLQQAIGQLSGALGRLNRNLASLESTTERLDDIVAKIDRGEGTLGRLVNDESLYVKMDSAATNLNAILRDLQENPRRYLSEVTLLELF